MQPSLKQTPPDLVSIGSTREFPAIWRMTEDAIGNTICFRLGQDVAFQLPTGRMLDWSNQLILTVHHEASNPARLRNIIHYKLSEADYRVRVCVTGTVTSSPDKMTVHIDLEFHLNERLFFRREWTESLPPV